jgi:hypothetical protein
MRKIGFAIAASMMAMASAVTHAAFGAQAGDRAEGGSPAGVVPLRQKHRGKGMNSRRGKGATNPPKKHPNMNHVSKRTKRKHRRAA